MIYRYVRAAFICARFILVAYDKRPLGSATPVAPAAAIAKAAAAPVPAAAIAKAAATPVPGSAITKAAAAVPSATAKASAAAKASAWIQANKGVASDGQYKRKVHFNPSFQANCCPAGCRTIYTCLYTIFARSVFCNNEMEG